MNAAYTALRPSNSEDHIYEDTKQEERTALPLNQKNYSATETAGQTERALHIDDNGAGKVPPRRPRSLVDLDNDGRIMKEVRKLLKCADRDKNNKISAQEVRDLFRGFPMHIDEEEEQNLFRDIDFNEELKMEDFAQILDPNLQPIFREFETLFQGNVSKAVCACCLWRFFSSVQVPKTKEINSAIDEVVGDSERVYAQDFSIIILVLWRKQLELSRDDSKAEERGFSSFINIPQDVPRRMQTRNFQTFNAVYITYHPSVTLKLNGVDIEQYCIKLHEKKEARKFRFLYLTMHEKAVKSIKIGMQFEDAKEESECKTLGQVLDTHHSHYKKMHPLWLPKEDLGSFKDNVQLQMAESRAVLFEIVIEKNITNELYDHNNEMYLDSLAAKACLYEKEFNFEHWMKADVDVAANVQVFYSSFDDVVYGVSNDYITGRSNRIYKKAEAAIVFDKSCNPSNTIYELFENITCQLKAARRYHIIKDKVLHGQDNEFNIWRSIAFAPSDAESKDPLSVFKYKEREFKLSIGILGLLLQLALTSAVTVQVIRAWDLRQMLEYQPMITVISFLVFSFLSFSYMFTVLSFFRFYNDIKNVIAVPPILYLFDFVSNIVVGFIILLVSLFYLMESEELTDVVLNSFALAFIVELDDLANMFESDEPALMNADWENVCSIVSLPDKKNAVFNPETNMVDMDLSWRTLSLSLCYACLSPLYFVYCSFIVLRNTLCSRCCK